MEQILPISVNVIKNKQQFYQILEVEDFILKIIQKLEIRVRKIMKTEIYEYRVGKCFEISYSLWREYFDISFQQKQLKHIQLFYSGGGVFGQQYYKMEIGLKLVIFSKIIQVYIIQVRIKSSISFYIQYQNDRKVGRLDEKRF
ncbi:unnamed protein product [Paramecium sonneborni]|uniref:Uncharacterized protein n=1 Tax=Paramecium sonneborni TaxID=65129 RepID=A0A8S1Q370_9CILI|nr:unnamed protein product [Paramecium sonneborni]